MTKLKEMLRNLDLKQLDTWHSRENLPIFDKCSRYPFQLQGVGACTSYDQERLRLNAPAEVGSVKGSPV